MDWFGGRVSLGSLDLAGAVNKLQESVKNIEKNFDNALGLEDKPESSTEAPASWSSTFDPVMSFMGQKGEEEQPESKDSEIPQVEEGSAGCKEELPEPTEPTPEPDLSLLERQKGADNNEVVNPANDPYVLPEKSVEVNEQNEHIDSGAAEEACAVTEDSGEVRSDAEELTASTESTIQQPRSMDHGEHLTEEDKSEVGPSEQSELAETKGLTDEVEQHRDHNATIQSSVTSETHEYMKELTIDRSSSIQEEMSSDGHAGNQIEYKEATDATSVTEPKSPIKSADSSLPIGFPSDKVPDMVSDEATEESNTKLGAIEVLKPSSLDEVHGNEIRLSSASNISDSGDGVIELEKVKREMKMMEAALQGAARQAQAKADEIANLMHENEQLKSVAEELRRKSSDAEIESLREEYHQRVSTLERKVYTLTKERDTLRREQNKRSDAAALLKEKDEIITQVMAEGEQLSKKQAAQEAQMRKLRAQIRELEEEKKAFITKLQLEESKVDSIKKDKAATEKLLQETIEKNQAELAAQKDYYTKALDAAKEAEALAEARANNEARTELEGRLREAEVRETVLVQALEELRQTLSREEQQATVKEDMLRRENEDLQKRYQESERRCEELVTQLPESTRPLLRQIEAMQETSARKAEAWGTVERTLQSRLQEAEAKAAAAEERERSINERLSQTLSRVNVLEAQISCLRAEQTQLNRSLEKERQRAGENRQEYLAAKEEADTLEARMSQLEEEIRELKRKHKNELQESLTYRELLQQELEREKAAKLEFEKAARVQSSSVSDQSPTTKNKLTLENGNLMRKPSSASSLGNMEESFFLQASLDSGNSLERKNSGESTMSSYYLKSMTSNSYEAALRQKEGELASYISRLASLESIRDSLAEELVKLTEQCEKLRIEAAMLPGMRAELDALRRRHAAALELMGERDEELEELRNDIVDLKEMYREQVNLLVNKIQTLNPQMGAA